MSYIDVKFRVDGMNVLRDDCPFKMSIGKEFEYATPTFRIFPTDDDGYSVLIFDVTTASMVNVLKSKGYEVIKKEVLKYDEEKSKKRAKTEQNWADGRRNSQRSWNQTEKKEKIGGNND